MQLGQYIFGCSGAVLTASERSFFKDSQPFGFILFARNIENPAQLTQLTQDLRQAVGWHAPVLIDQEGGRVARMAAPHWETVPPALDHANCADPARSYYLRSRIIAAQLQAVGIDVNCAPLADIARADTHAVLRNRCYGDTADQVIAAAHAVVQGQADGGVASVVKHIPGHGRGNLDSHLELPTVTATHAELSATDFKTFQALNGCTMGMTAHIVFKDIDPMAPATQSPVMIELIRKEIGFSGLLMTDDISMNALSGSVVERAAKSIDAGCDLILHCNGDMAEMQALAGSLQRLTGAAHLRAEAALNSRPSPTDVDIAALKAEFMALVNKG